MIKSKCYLSYNCNFLFDRPQEILPDDDADQQAKGFKSFLMTEVNLDQDKRNTRRLDDDDVTQGKSSDVSQGTVKDVTRDTFNEVTKYTSSDVTQGTNTDKTQTTINTITQDSDVTKESTNDVTLEKSSDVTKDTISDVTHRLESGVLETDFDEDFHSAVGESPEVSDQVSISPTFYDDCTKKIDYFTI